jgi:hypothetical protein
MALEMYVHAPNGESDRQRIKDMLLSAGYFVERMQLEVFAESQEEYFSVTVSEHDTSAKD